MDKTITFFIDDRFNHVNSVLSPTPMHLHNHIKIAVKIDNKWIKLGGDSWGEDVVETRNLSLINWRMVCMVVKMEQMNLVLLLK